MRILLLLHEGISWQLRNMRRGATQEASGTWTWILMPIASPFLPPSGCSVEWHVQVQNYEPWLQYVYTMYSSPATLLPIMLYSPIYSVFQTIYVDMSKTG